jgi:hypothetical protein
MKKEMLESLMAVLRKKPHETLKIRPISFDERQWNRLELIHYPPDTKPDCIVLWDEDDLNCIGLEYFDEAQIKKICNSVK